ncbi:MULTISPECIES: hypothetical protein [Citromicrobium]|uniref:VpaChn25_0724 family phage protein n=1 Tax=Citromicrobium TaxID=72173 RepID=UPI0001DD10D5|nr:MULTISPECIES: hypothetical protein [Citromicrobium]ALG60891.1 hypothetical protein WG74_08630 [Citromicrobium sp. JL477]
MSFKNSLSDAIAAEARLIILRELAGQTDGRLSSLSIRSILDVHAIRRDGDWIATQLRKLESLGAVELGEAGSTLIAKITRTGRDHVEERAVLSGVARPSEAE